MKFLQGKGELQRAFKNLESKGIREIETATMRKVNMNIKRDIRLSVPAIKFKRKKTKRWKESVFDSSELAKHVISVKRKGTRTGNAYSVIGFEGGRGGWRDWSHWLEFGTMGQRIEPFKKGQKERSPEAQAMTAKGMGLVKKPFFRNLITAGTASWIGQMERDAIVAIKKTAEKYSG